MNHRDKRRAKRGYIHPEVARHKQREANRAKLNAKLKPVEERKSFLAPPAVEVAPLFPTRVEESNGVTVVEVGINNFRRSRINAFPNILKVSDSVKILPL